MAENGREKTAPSLEEYQQSSCFLTAASQDWLTSYGVPAVSSSMPAAQSGHSEGVHKLLGIRSRISRGMWCFPANPLIASPSPRSAPIATTRALRACKSKYVPRTAEPALITSFTIAMRFALTAGCSAVGRRYSTGNYPSRVGSLKRSVYANSQPSSRETSNPTNAPSTSGPHTSSTSYGASCAASRPANGRISRECRHNVSSWYHRSP